ncbi:MAG: J domain-containing protein [Spirulina sp. SIO3F2]|nr:J domain-containing protein [Spirulina sp. SIO3F2]
MTDLTHCYQILGLAQGASLSEIKTAYRDLARRYHPDTCAEELRAQAQTQFIQINHAYKQLLKTWPTSSFTSAVETTTGVPTTAPPVSPIRQQQDAQLKHQSYHKLHDLLQARRFARAIALIEGLALRLPLDPEVRQWQAIAYFQWGKQLVEQRQWGKAKVYLRKAIRTDPHNQELFRAVEQQLQQLQRRATF